MPFPPLLAKQGIHSLLDFRTVGLRLSCHQLKKPGNNEINPCIHVKIPVPSFFPHLLLHEISQ